jgi:type VI secretion system protein ImpJ
MPLAWFEGLQLLPQHFEAIDARTDAVLVRHFNVVQPYFWGLDELHIDEDSLSNGLLSIVKVSGCFPDGLVFEWTSAQDGALETTMEGGEDISRYCLAIGIEDANDKGLRIPRFEKFISLSKTGTVANDDDPALIKWKPNIRVKKYIKNDTKFHQIPFVDILRKARGYEIAGYHPPSVRIIVGSACHKILLNFAKLLRVKADLIKVNPVGIVNAENYQNSLGWIFNCVASGLVNLETVLNDESAHPQHVFRTLCNIVASTSSLAGKLPPRLPTYSHLDIAERIESVIDIAERAIDPIRIDYFEWRAHAFLLNEGEWQVAVPEKLLADEFLVRVIFDPIVSITNFQNWLENVLIYMTGQKENYREMRVRGLDRRIDTNPPEFDLPLGSGGIFFRVFSTSEIKGSNNRLVMENPDERLSLNIKSLSLMEIIHDPATFEST